MSHLWFQKPENALKRAKELISIPTNDKALEKKHKTAALEILHDTITSRRHKAWQKPHEEIMFKYVEICVELQLSRVVKDGLHQYRNLCQQQNPGSLENVINHLVDEAENRAKQAKLDSDHASLAAAVGVDDLEAGQTPESILLSTTTMEDSRDRNDRVVVVPWLKFLWETYRIILEVLRCNSKLEPLYHSISSKAFNFCTEYSRKVEFRRLCDILRTHLSNLQKHVANPTGQSTRHLRGWEGWTPESVELHLQTRYEQLEVAVALELWTEGFRTIEDIHLIMGIIKRQPKVSLMATYFEKLTQIFWVSENFLFHAYAWYKFYILSRNQNTKLTEDQLSVMASSVVLAALSIPIFDETNSVNASFSYDITKEKTHRMATLLGFVSAPSRSHLLQQLCDQKITSESLPEIQGLFQLVENDFQPFQIVSFAQPTLEFLRNHETLNVYVPALEKLLVQRLVKQLATVYRSVSIDHFRLLLKGLDVSFHEVEQLVVNCVQNGQIHVRIDHCKGCLHFHTVTVESDCMKTQLSLLSRRLAAIVGKIYPNEHVSQSELEEQKQVFSSTRKNLQEDHVNTLQRKLVIERRKEDMERVQREKIKIEERKKLHFEQQRMELEKARLEEEAKLRAKEKMQKIKDEIALKETKQMLDQLGRDTENIDIGGLTGADRAKIIRESREKTLKVKEEAQKKLRDQAKRLDYITRATREVEQPILAQAYEEQLKLDRGNFELTYTAKVKQREEEHEFALKEKSRLGRMLPHLDEFVRNFRLRRSTK